MNRRRTVWRLNDPEDGEEMRIAMKIDGIAGLMGFNCDLPSGTD